MSKPIKNERRKPDPAPVDVSKFEWHLMKLREEPTIYSRGADGLPVPHFVKRPEPEITVIIDEGSCVRTYKLLRKREAAQ